MAKPYQGEVNLAYQDTEYFHQREKSATMADELSFSHILRDENSIIPGKRPYGEAVAMRLMRKNLIKTDSPSIVEVGCGLGDFARTAIPAFLQRYPGMSYTMVDLSPGLKKAQVEATMQYGKRVMHVIGNAEELGFLSGVDLLISNEVIGDLSAIIDIPRSRLEEEAHPLRAQNSKWWKIARQYMSKYRLSMNPEAESWGINYGAFRMIEGLQKVLSDKGSAFLVEHAAKTWQPLRLPGHVEYAIVAPHLINVAEGNGFKVTDGSLDEFLGIRIHDYIVDCQSVNVSLIAGMPIAVNNLSDEIQAELARWAMGVLRSNPPAFTHFDKAMRPQEFLDFASEQGWNMFTEDNLPLENAGLQARSFKYFLLRKNPASK